MPTLSLPKRISILIIFGWEMQKDPVQVYKNLKNPTDNQFAFRVYLSSPHEKCYFMQSLRGTLNHFVRADNLFHYEIPLVPFQKSFPIKGTMVP